MSVWLIFLYLPILVVHSSQAFPLLPALHHHLDLLDFNKENWADMNSFFSQCWAIRRMTHYAITHALGQENIQLISLVHYICVWIPVQVLSQVSQLTAPHSILIYSFCQDIFNSSAIIVLKCNNFSQWKKLLRSLRNAVGRPLMKKILGRKSEQNLFAEGILFSTETIKIPNLYVVKVCYQTEVLHVKFTELCKVSTTFFCCCIFHVTFQCI